MLPFQHFRVCSEDWLMTCTRNPNEIRYFESFFVLTLIHERDVSDYRFKCLTNIIKTSMFNTVWAGFQSRLITRRFANSQIFMTWATKWKNQSWSTVSQLSMLKLNLASKTPYKPVRYLINSNRFWNDSFIKNFGKIWNFVQRKPKSAQSIFKKTFTVSNQGKNCLKHLGTNAFVEFRQKKISCFKIINNIRYDVIWKQIFLIKSKFYESLKFIKLAKMFKSYHSRSLFKDIKGVALQFWICLSWNLFHLTNPPRHFLV